MNTPPLQQLLIRFEVLFNIVIYNTVLTHSNYAIIINHYISTQLYINIYNNYLIEIEGSDVNRIVFVHMIKSNRTNKVIMLGTTMMLYYK